MSPEVNLVTKRGDIESLHKGEDIGPLPSVGL